MPSSCSAINCFQRHSKESKKAGITFHRFPKDPEKCALWVRSMRRVTVDGKPWQPSSSDRLCSKHFKPEMFDRTGQTVRLRENAIPTEFDFRAHLQVQTTVRREIVRHVDNSPLESDDGPGASPLVDVTLVELISKAMKNEGNSGKSKTVAIIEPFYGGSHKQLIDLLVKDLDECVIFSQSAKKWHWRARTSALHFALTIPEHHQFRVLFCSCVLNLAELIALRPDFGKLKKIIYFHENQLVYPVRKQQERDFQYGYNQILSCLVADVIIFNSRYNMESFLGNINGFFHTMPDYRPKGLEERIRPKCNVLYFPVDFPPLSCISKVEMQAVVSGKDSISNDGSEHSCSPLHIVWPHRWEHDKDPEFFFHVMFRLEESGLPFKLSVLGEGYTSNLPIFDEARSKLSSHIENWGYLDSKDDYYRVLSSADVAISTAQHEFFGVAMMESTYLGCYPLVPNRLVYPEIFPPECLYKTEDQLLKKLRNFCNRPTLARLQMDLSKFSWENLRSSYVNIIQAH